MSADEELLPFLPLGEFAWPSLPADDRLRMTFASLKAEILRSKQADEPVVADDQLAGATAHRLDVIAAPPACGQLLEELDATYDEWLSTSHPVNRIQMIVLPPCDENDVLASWARGRGLSCLAPPDRSDLTSVNNAKVPDLDGEGVLVIPRLEDWFIRHQSGLNTIRALLAQIAVSKRRCIIGCNSWAWAYLSATIDVQLQMPGAFTFQAFDRNRLFDWFSRLASNSASDVSNFRISDSGLDVFAKSEDGEPEADFFQKLAAHSLGIPWVAWNLWRKSLRTDREDAEIETHAHDDDDDETLWVASLDSFSIPTQQRQSALLVLQSLLIHGPLSVQNLRLTVPLVGSSNVAQALVNSGFIRLEDGVLSCVPAAYPAMRKELSNAGFSMDRL